MRLCLIERMKGVESGVILLFACFLHIFCYTSGVAQEMAMLG